MVKLTDLLVFSVVGIASGEVWLQIRKRLFKEKNNGTT